MKLSTPVFKNMIIDSTMSKMARTFGMLLGAGVPVVETMGLVHRVVDNIHYKNAIKEATQFVKDGYSIAASLKKTEAFPHTLLSLAATGEKTGEMEKMLTKGGRFYDKQLEAVIGRLTSLIEPMLIVLIALVIGTIVIVILLAHNQLRYGLKERSEITNSRQTYSRSRRGGFFIA
jgi:type IV pilus assembly protein PilC